MKVIILNGSPRKGGSVSAVLHTIRDELAGLHDVDWVEVCELQMVNCRACMACRETESCVLPEDDAHRIGERIRGADVLVVGTPTYWGNMCAPLKLLFERNVPVFLEERPRRLPRGRQRGKQAIIVTACATPWPFNFLMSESRGAIRAVGKILKAGGYRIVGTYARPGTGGDGSLNDAERRQVRKLTRRLRLS